MNKLSISILSVCFALSTSCTGFLEEIPKSEMSSAENYKTLAQCQAAVNNLYRVGVNNWSNTGVYSGSHLMLGGYASGLFDNLNYKGQESYVQYFQELTQSPNNISGKIDNYWNQAYQAIQRANLAIKYIPKATDPAMTQEAKDQYVREARLFRALNYLFLVRHFGAVPMPIEPFESLNDINMPRTPVKDVYDLIFADLTEAAKLTNRAMTQNNMRVTATVANALLADAALSSAGYPLNDATGYAKAAAAAKAVIASGQHTLLVNNISSGAPLGIANPGENSAFNQLRKKANNKSTEYIYPIEFDGTINSSNFSNNSYPVEVGALGSSLVKVTLTNNAYRPIKQYMNVYDSINDLRCWERQFFSSYFVYNGGKDTLRSFSSNLPAAYFFLDEDAMFISPVSNRSFPLIRYAEVLLVAAEALAQTSGVTDEAAGYLAEVRARGYIRLTKEQIKAQLLTLSKEKFVEECWIERMREFPYENKIWVDIQRTQKYPTTQNSNPGKVTFVNFVGASNNWGKTFKERDRLWPLSYNEVQRNPNLEQNPGYN